MSTELKPWQAIAEQLQGIEIITESNQITKLSLDYYYFSPILYEQLKDKRADLVIRPSNEAEVIEIAKLCYRYQVPLTVRGAGTGNYGQCIPLQAGVILDLTKMNRIEWLKPGMAAVEPGVKMSAFDKQARKIGWELRMAPSTYRTATIGGFIGGGSVGMGSINYGQISERGNLQKVRLVTMTETPEVIELSGDEVKQVIHGYGTTGIITQLEIPLAPAFPWAEIIVIFDEFMSAARFGQALSDSDGIVKKLVSIHAAPIPSYFAALQNYLSSGKHGALLMISEYDLVALEALVTEFQGEITYCKKAQEITSGTSLLEFTWNHTTLHARTVDPNLTYLQVFYFTLDKVEQMYRYFGDEVVIHLEFLKAGGKAVPAGLPLVRYRTATRLKEIIDYHETQGAFIANPHVYTIEDGGNKTIDPQKVKFKQQIDPCGLLNPGKMRGFSKLI